MPNPRATFHATTHAISNRPADALKRVRARLPQLGVAVWAGLWAWFFAADGLRDYVAERSGSALAVAVIALVTLAGLATAAWMRPLLGSILLVGFGIFALWFFQGATAVLLLALPPLVLGAVMRARLPAASQTFEADTDEA